ncbi:MAG TPA: hypothetical protein VFR97_01630 [Capillimicrobium sp.]|nr:hypothetical protein [Capillimicrobium sp.]
MRKLALLSAALVAVLAMAAVAIGQTTGYTVSGSTKPAKPGSKSKPVPVALAFGLQAEHGSNRPTTASRFRLEVEGLRTNGKYFKTCTTTQINNSGNDDVCSGKAVVGTGVVNNLAGATSNPADASIPCNLSVTLYNAGQNKVALFLEGAPSGTAQKCAIPISQAIDARWVKAGKSLALQFDIPSTLQNPVTGVSNGISQIRTTIKKLTVKKKGKTIGYAEVIGCSGGKRDLVLTTTNAGGGTLTGRATAKC